MSEADPTPSQAEEKKPSSVAPAKDGKIKPRRKWRRRIIITLVVLVALVVIARLSVSLLLPPVLNKVAGIYGLTAKYDRLELYAGGGDIGLWNLRFTPKDGGEPILQTAYCRGAVSLWGLVQGKLRVKRVEAEDATLLIERAEDGSLPALEQLLKSDGQPAKPVPTQEPSDHALTLDPPLKIDVLRLQNARARVRDLSQQPAVDASMDMDLLVTDVGSLDKQTRVEMQLHSPEALGALYVSVVGDSRDNKLQAELTLTLFGLNLEPATPYLAPLGIVPTAGNISGKASGTLEATLVPIGPAPADGKPAPTALAAKLTLNDMNLTADSQTTASVKSVVVDVASFTPDAIRVADVSVNGVRANAARNASGNLQFAGIELVPVQAGSAPAPVAQPTAAPATSQSVGAGAAPIFELKNLSVEDVIFTFDDAATPEPAQLGVQLSKMQVQHVSTDPAQQNQPITIAVDASAPGLVKSLNLSGEAALATDVKTFDLAFTGTGINPEAAAPYLQMLGLRSQITDGVMKGQLVGSMQTLEDGTLTASTAVRNITVTDQQRTLFAMPLVDLKDLQVSPDGSRIKVASIAIEGPVVPIERNADGIVSVLGVQFAGDAVPGEAAPSTTQPAGSSAATAPATQPTAPLTLPAIEIQQFTWNGANISFDDRMNEQSVDLALSDVSVELRNLLLDPNATEGTPGTLVMKVRSPGVVEQFDLNGKITPSSQKLTVELLGNAAGLTVEAFKPLLSEIGIEPVMKDGNLQFLVLGTLATTDDGIGADLSISDVQLNDGSTQWLGLGELSVRQAAIGAGGVSVDSIEITDAAALVQRDEEGLVSAGGFKMLPAKPVAPVVAAAPVTTETPTTAPAQVADAAARLRLLKVNNASLHVQDAYVLPAADLSVKVDAEIKDVILGKDATPATFNAKVSSPGVVDSLKTAGAFLIGNESQMVDLQVSATGISGKGIESYLPPNATTHFNNGEFAAAVAASIEKNDEGGIGARLDIRDVRLFDGVTRDPVAGVNAVRVNVERLDLAGHRIAVKEVAVEGAQLAVTQDDDGTKVAGLTLWPESVRPVREAKPEPEPIASEQGTNVDVLLQQQRQEKVPLVTLETLSIQADRLSFASPALAEPVSVVGLSLKNVAPIELLGDEPSARPPVDLQLRGAVENLVDSISADAHLAPFAAEPLAKVNVDINGIHANELTKLMPDLAGKVDGTGLSNGRFTTSAEAHFAYTRRGAMGIDLTRDITAEVAVLNTRLTQDGVEKPLAGLDEFRGERIRYSPASVAVVIQSLEFVKPAAHILRDAQGLHAFGFTILTPPEGAGEADTVTAEKPADAPAAVATNADAADGATPPAAPGAEVRIDQLIVSGADILIEDQLGNVPTIIPINSLDVEVKGLSNRVMSEPKPVRFNAIVGAGKVPLVQGNGQVSERPVFAEASASGNMVFFPQLKGYAKTSLSGLELTALTGLASQADIKINGGTFDVRTDVRMQGDDAMVARVYPTFNELRVSEPPGGPIQRILQLPAPLDVVIAALEAADGSISVPLEVPMKAGELNTGAVIGSAVASIARVTAEAMVAAPLKAAKLVGMLGGADVSSARTRGLDPVVLQFTPGESQLTGDQRQAIEGVIDQLKRDGTIEVTIQHTLGAEDVTLAGERSNPAADDSLALASRLRQRKMELQREQMQQISQVRVLLASQDVTASNAAIEKLRATSISLKETEDGLNQLLDMLRPGADRQTERRTKAASILLGDLRLRSVQQMLLDSNVSTISERVRKANALYNPAEDQAQPGEVTLVLVRAAK